MQRGKELNKIVQNPACFIKKSQFLYFQQNKPSVLDSIIDTIA